MVYILRPIFAIVPPAHHHNRPHVQDSDLSHPEFFRSMKFAPKPGMKPSGPVPGPKDQGQPGCTDREREGFAELLERGGLVVRLLCVGVNAWDMSWM